jgi:hypothetical protein
MYEIFSNYWVKGVDSEKFGEGGSSIYIYGREWFLIGYVLIAAGSMIGYIPFKSTRFSTTKFRSVYIAITAYMFWGSLLYVAV